MEKKNIRKTLEKVERLLTLIVTVLISIILFGILILSYIYLSTLISFQPYAVWKDIEKNPKFYILISFGISFVFVMAILSSALLLRIIKSFKE